MTERKQTASTDEPASRPVLYFTGRGSKATVPERDLYAADLAKRSKAALIATGLYSEKRP
jgi:hypothetical protein